MLIIFTTVNSMEVLEGGEADRNFNGKLGLETKI